MKKQKQLTCIVRMKKGKRRVTAFALVGQWAVHPLILGDGKELQFSSTTATVSHQPTGYRACDIYLRKDYTAMLVRYNELFGQSITVAGVMRKYGALSQRDKSWVTCPQLSK